MTMDTLPIEILRIEICERLTDPTAIRAMANVCRRWRSAVLGARNWKIASNRYNSAVMLKSPFDQFEWACETGNFPFLKWLVSIFYFTDTYWA